MRGRRSVFSRLGVLETRAVQRARRFDRRARVDLSQLSDTELEALAALAEKAEITEAAGGAPEWTEEDLALLADLDAWVTMIAESGS